MTNTEMIYTGEICRLEVMDPFDELFLIRGILHGNIWIVELWEDTWESAPDMNEPLVVDVVGKAAYTLDSNGDAHVMELS